VIIKPERRSRPDPQCPVTRANRELTPSSSGNFPFDEDSPRIVVIRGFTVRFLFFRDGSNDQYGPVFPYVYSHLLLLAPCMPGTSVNERGQSKSRARVERASVKPFELYFKLDSKKRQARLVVCV
jgi:hypothetical protein